MAAHNNVVAMKGIVSEVEPPFFGLMLEFYTRGSMKDVYKQIDVPLRTNVKVLYARLALTLTELRLPTIKHLWPDLTAGTIRRIADSARVRRYRIVASKELDAPATDARPFAVHESESSDGVLAWGREGLLSWVRTVTAETRVAEAPRRAFRSGVVQRIELRRLGGCSMIR